MPPQIASRKIFLRPLPTNTTPQSYPQIKQCISPMPKQKTQVCTLSEKVSLTSSCLGAYITLSFCKSVGAKLDCYKLVPLSKNPADFIHQVYTKAREIDPNLPFIYRIVYQLLTSSWTLHLIMRVTSCFLHATLTIFVGKAHAKLCKMKPADYIKLIEQALEEASTLLQHMTSRVGSSNNLSRVLENRYSHRVAAVLLDQVITQLCSHLYIGFFDHWRLCCAFTLIRWILPWLKPLLEHQLERQIELVYSNKVYRAKIFHELVKQINSYADPKKLPLDPKHRTKIAKKYRNIARNIRLITQKSACPLLRHEVSQITQTLFKPIKNTLLIQIVSKLTKSASKLTKSASKIFEMLKLNQLYALVSKYSGIKRIAVDIVNDIEETIEKSVITEVNKEIDPLLPELIDKLDQTLVWITSKPSIDKTFYLMLDKVIESLSSPPPPPLVLEQEKALFKKIFCHKVIGILNEQHAKIAKTINHHFETAFTKHRLEQFKKTALDYLYSTQNTPEKLKQTLYKFYIRNRQINQANLGVIVENYEKLKNSSKAIAKASYLILRFPFLWLGGNIVLSASHTWGKAAAGAASKVIDICTDKIASLCGFEHKKKEYLVIKKFYNKIIARSLSRYVVHRIDQTIDSLFDAACIKQAAFTGLSLANRALANL